MIYINNNLNNKLNKLTNDNFYIIADFDRTLTTSNSVSTWSILSKDNLMSEEYNDDSKKLFNIYFPIEMDNSISDEEKISKMDMWWEQHLNLFIKHNVTYDFLQKLGATTTLIPYRKGLHELMDYSYSNKIPFFIMSAGLGDMIEAYLIKNNLLHSNVSIISNFIEAVKGRMVSIKGKVIHSYNKSIEYFNNEQLNKIAKKPYTILFGDTLADIKMIPAHNRNNTIAIAFVENKNNDAEEIMQDKIEAYKNTFDIVCSGDTTFEDLFAELNNKFNLTKRLFINK